MIKSPAGRRLAAAALTATMLAGAASAANAVEPVAKIRGSISPNNVGAPRTGVGLPVALSIKTSFTTDTPVAFHPFTVTKATVFFPAGAKTNGALFPSCSAAKINANNGSFSRCPKKSKIGSGTLDADVPVLELEKVPGTVTMFNGPKGKSVVFHIRATTPAFISEAFQAPLVKLKGKYGYKLTLSIPSTLQDVGGGQGWFVGVTRFDVKTSGTIVKNGVKRGYIEAYKCPRSGKAPLKGTFEFRGGASTSASSSIKCN